MASTRLTRTFTTPTNNKIWTLSFWVKRGSLGASQWVINTDSGNQEDRMHFNPEDRLNYYEQDSGGGTLANFIPTAQLRDTNGWYHVVLSRDSTQATASDRLKMYYNGELQTVFTANTYPSQNSSNRLNTAVEHEIGARNSSSYFDGSMSHIHFIDGTAYDATAFGQYDANGVWTIKTSPSVTYGNNGFFILKDGNSVTDQSGNGNNFTVGGGNVTNTEDNPSNVFNTMTALAKSTKVDLANGGCTTIGNTTSGSGRCRSNWNIPNYGKWYFEYKMIADNQGNTYPNSGIKYNAEIVSSPETSTSTPDIYVYGIYSGELIHVNNGTSITAGAPASSGDIFGWSIDMDNGAIYIHRNGTYINSGNPTSGASKTGAIYSFTPSDYPNMCVVSNEFGNSETQYNFGNGYFGTTAVASAGTNASGNGIFEYDVPTGFTALSTKGLNL